MPSICKSMQEFVWMGCLIDLPLIIITAQDAKSPVCSNALFPPFPFKLWHILQCSTFVFKMEIVVDLLHPNPFCSWIFFFFSTNIPIPQSLLTVSYWSGSWYLNWSMYSVTCLRYPTWAISLNNVFINWLIITVRLISCIYICVFSTIDL